MLAMGTLGDRLGRKRVMLGGLARVHRRLAVRALAPTVSTLVAAGSIMGVGAAASEPGTLSIIRHLYPERAPRARALGVWAAVAGLALAMGPVIGGVLVGLGGWRTVFWFNLGAGLLVLLAALVTVPESADPQAGRIDVAGFILGPLALGTAIFAVIHGETTGYRDPAVVALFVLSAVAASLFVVVEQRSRAPDLRPPLPAASAVHRRPDGRLCRLLRHLLHLLLHRALPAGRGGLLGLPHGRPVRAHGGRHDRRLGLDGALGGARRAAPADRARLSRRRRRHAGDRRGAARSRRLRHARPGARPGRPGLRHRRRAGHLGRARGRAGRALGHGRRSHDDGPRARVGGRRGRARLAAQRHT